MRWQVTLKVQRSSGFTLDVEMDVETDALALVGASGAGKSTLLDAIAGVRPEGRVVLDGVDVSGVPLARRRVGYVTQDPALFPHLDVAAHLAFGVHAGDIDRVVDAFGLEALLDRKPAQLSGGERRRVALGRALANRPELLLLDEPFAGLDGTSRRAAVSLLHDVKKRFGVPLAVVSHLPEEVLGLADVAVRLGDGRVQAIGPVASVLQTGETAIDNHLVGEVCGADRVRVGDVELAVPLSDGGPGQVRLAIRAHDVLLAAATPEGLSARNVIPAVVAEVTPVAGAWLVRLESPALLVTVTDSARRELAIAPGTRLHAVLKATSISVLGED